MSKNSKIEFLAKVHRGLKIRVPFWLCNDNNIEEGDIVRCSVELVKKEERNPKKLFDLLQGKRSRLEEEVVED
jgi:hypothetical protein